MIIIAGVSKNGIIGNKGTIPWHNKDDMSWFKSKTTEGYNPVVIMGRATFESLGAPLPNRLNVVISKKYPAIPGVKVFPSYEEATEYSLTKNQFPYIIGGAKIYERALLDDRVKEIYLSLIDEEVVGDARFPWINPSKFCCYEIFKYKSISIARYEVK